MNNLNKINQLQCKLAEYTALYAGKLLWGLDCDILELSKEIDKLHSFIIILESLETENNCKLISQRTLQKINSYIRNLNRQGRLTTCNYC